MEQGASYHSGHKGQNRAALCCPTRVINDDKWGGQRDVTSRQM